MSTLPALPAELEAPRKLVLEAFEDAKSTHIAALAKFNRFYRLYRSYSDWDRSFKDAAPRDVDALLRDGQRAFGESMFIPYIFSVIETQVPRIIVNNPRVNVRPGDPKQENGVDAVKLILDRQQTRTAYPLTLQRIAKSGLMYGLAVGTMDWERQVGKKARLECKDAGDRLEWVKKDVDEHVIYEGAQAGCLDVFDFIWDELAYDGASMRHAIQRTWRPNSYIAEMVERKHWTLPEGYTVDDLCSHGTDAAKHDDVWRDRMRAAGFAKPDGRGGNLHEVWQFHDGVQVITVLDRATPVLTGKNPYWHGELRYQVYRPTEVPHEMVGIGEPEAIEELQIELNELRTSRRDNARLVMQRPFAYFEGLVNPADVEFGPGMMIPVDGDPRELLFPIPLQDIPNSSVTEEQALKGDLDRASGIDDNAAGVGGAPNAQTATGAQLVQQAASLRVQNKTMRLNLEVVTPQIRQQLELNQQKIVETKQMPGPPRPGDMTNRSWSWYKVGPEQLAGEWELEVDPNSMSPENTVQDRNDATLVANLFRGDPDIDQRKMKLEVLAKAGVKNPEAWLTPKDPQVPAMVLDMVKQELVKDYGVDPTVFDHMVLDGMQAVQQTQQGVDGGSIEPGPPEAPVSTP